MPLMEWSTQLGVGISRFDHDHQRLFAMINALFDAIQAGDGRQALEDILDGLVTYTKVHFAEEEHFMHKLGYPDVEDHIAEHAALVRRVVDIQRRFHAGASSALSQEVLTFLKTWWEGHIQGTDRKYVPFFGNQGVN